MASRRISCLVCGGKEFADGTLADTADRTTVSHRVKTSLITSDWTDVTAKMCTSCGYIMLFGQIGPASETPRPYNDNNPLDV